MSYISSSINESNDLVSLSLRENLQLQAMTDDDINKRRLSMCPTLSENDQNELMVAGVISRDRSIDSLSIVDHQQRPSINANKATYTESRTGESSKQELLNNANMPKKAGMGGSWFSLAKTVKEKSLKDDKKSSEDLSKNSHTPNTPKRGDKRYILNSLSGLEPSARGSFTNIFANKVPGKPATETKTEEGRDVNTLSRFSTGGSSDSMSVHGDAFRMFSHTILATSTASKPIQVTVTWRLAPFSIKLLVVMTIGECIAAVLQELKDEIANHLTEVDDVTENTESFLLGKVDRNSPRLYTWMNSNTIAAEYGLEQGDQLFLKHITDVESVQVSIPPQTARDPFEYTFDTLVSNAIGKLRKDTTTETKERYGLYCPNYGMWLDESKTMFSYNLSGDTVLELRALANEFLMRIYLSDFDQKIAIKALPSLQVSDVLAMVQHQLGNRKLYVLKNCDYGLFVPSLNTWLKPDLPIEQCAEAKTEALHFRVQYQHLPILTPWGETMIPVDERATIRDALVTLKSRNTSPDADSFALHFPTGERLKDTDSTWTTLKEVSVMDRLRYRLASRKLFLTMRSDPSLAVEVDFDFSCKLEVLVPYICRRLGVRYSELRQILNDVGDKLDPSVSLIDAGVKAGSKICVEWEAQLSTSAPVDGQDVSIWDEPTNAETIQLTGGDGPDAKIVSATLNKLVEKLTEDKDQGTTMYLDFVKTFLLTYQSFTTSAHFLKKISDRYAVPNNKQLSWAEFDKFRSKIQLRVCNVILQWSKKYTWDFTHPVHGQAICESVLDFVDNTLAYEHTLMARQIRKNVFKIRDGSIVMSPKRMFESWKSTTGAKPDPNGIVFGYSAEDIGNQLTMIEGYLFSEITPSELLGQAWTKKDANKRAPGILALTRRFNAVACWVGWSVLDGKTPRARAERLTKLIDIAQHLHSVNNFSTLMAIIAGINKAAISRLKQTAKELNTKTAKKLTDLEKLMSAESSYKNYRASIRSVAPPCIPYIGTYLIDLTYMEDGNPDEIQGRINYGKRELISNVIREMVGYQQTRYTIKPIEELAAILSNISEASEDVEKKMWLKSKQTE